MADNENELRERLELIEKMIASGRRQTESWGWTFLLWGIAFYVAIALRHLTHSGWAWPATMIAAGVITFLVAMRVKRSQPGTAMGRMMCSIWIGLGISMFLLFMSMTFNHMLYERVFVAVVCAMLGMANSISGITLKWKMQIACALAWWSASVAACFLNAYQSFLVFLVAIFFCQIVFGIYAVVRDSKRRNSGNINA